MITHLSKKEINTYCENVVPLYLVSDKDLKKEDIQWISTNNNIIIKRFCGINDKILITTVKEGKGTIICRYNGTDFVCNINISKRQNESYKNDFNSYSADFHIHTTNIHNADEYEKRTAELPGECISSIAQSGTLDCSVLSDHAGITNDADFLKCFIADEEVSHNELVVFPGMESMVTDIKNDRFGIPHNYAGEMVTINASSYCDSQSWEEFYDKMADCPYAIVSLAHPSIVGWFAKGVWNFNLYKNSYNPEFKRLVKLVEIGDGQYKETSMLYHYTYSQALDCGLKVSPCSSSDSHGSYKPVSGKTFVLSSGKTKEMFYDAILNNRVYASESGCVNISFCVNGAQMGQTLPLTDTYTFSIEAWTTNDKGGAMPIECSVISDYGKKLKTIEFDGKAEFELKSDTARYFYVLLTDKEGRKTFTSPVWTGRTFDDFSDLDNFKAIDKSRFTATNEKTGENADILINSNPYDVWEANDKTASVIIDMKEIKSICGVGHYPPLMDRQKMREEKISIMDLAIRFVGEYKISVSTDNILYKEVKRGFIRVFGGEEILPFDSIKARYVKFEALTSVGYDTSKSELKDANISISELSIFEK